MLRRMEKCEKILHHFYSKFEFFTNIPLPFSILNNYLVWQTVRSFTACLSKAFRDAYKGLRKALIGSEGGEEPWRYCMYIDFALLFS